MVVIANCSRSVVGGIVSGGDEDVGLWWGE